MENSTRKFYNRAQLVNAQRGTTKNGEHKILNLMFSVWDKDERGVVTKWAKLFLNEKANERNRETLMHLGVEKPPEVVSYETVEKLDGLATRTVDLVCETNDQGYENVSFINQPKFGLRVFDMK